jgi:LysM repeat protein
MATNYVVARGDTLSKIADAKLGDKALAAALADYNGLPDARQIFVGQRIQLPARRELRPRPVARDFTPWPAPPQGFQAIRDTFGDILSYLRDDGSIDARWETERMVRAALPFPIPLAWDVRQSVTGVRCHKLIAPLVEAVFREIDARGLRPSVKTYGGCYVYRAKRGQVKPSTHSWGIAIDLNPNTNAMGTAGDMDPRLVELFDGFGFTWGGRWSGGNKDPMHFQYCSGY